MKDIILKLSITAVFIFGSVSSYSASSGYVTLNQVGCHLNDGTCYVYIENAVGPAQCSSNSLRWNKDSASSGKEILSLLMMAFASGKKVNFGDVDTCQGSFPTFMYISVQK